VSEQKRNIRFVDGSDFQQIKTMETTLFDRTGEPLEGEGIHKVQNYAKVVASDVTNRVTYYIRTYQGTPFDPGGPYGRRERNLDTKMERCSKNTFDLYLTFLKTNNSIYLTKAQRGLLND
jgi:hypothetical protein